MQLNGEHKRMHNVYCDVLEYEYEGVCVSF